jgi:hypothetical protein
MVCLGGRFFDHYFPALVTPLAILAALGTTDLPGHAPGWSRRLVVAGTVAPALVCLVAATRFETAMRWLGDARKPYAGVAAYIRARTRPADRIFVWGYFPLIYVAADRLSATRFVGCHYLTGYAAIGLGRVLPPAVEDRLQVPGGFEQLLRDLEQNRAELFVDTAPANLHGWSNYPVSRYPRLAAYLAAHFSPEAVVDGAVIYRRTRVGRRCVGLAGIAMRNEPGLETQRPLPALAPGTSTSGHGRRICGQRLAIKTGEPCDLGRLDLDLARAGGPQQVEHAPGFRVLGHLGISRHHVTVKMRVAFPHRRRVDAKRTGDLFEHAFEVTQGRAKTGGFAVVEVGRAADVALADQHHPAGHAVWCIDVAHVPQFVFEYGRTGGGADQRGADAARGIERRVLHEDADRTTGIGRGPDLRGTPKDQPNGS